MRTFSSFFFLNLVFVFLFHFLIGDTLFFLTDFYSMFVYVSVISLILLFFEIPIFSINKNYFLDKIALIFLIIIFFYSVLDISIDFVNYIFSKIMNFIDILSIYFQNISLTNMLKKIYLNIFSFNEKLAYVLKLIYQFFEKIFSFLFLVGIFFIAYHFFLKKKIDFKLLFNLDFIRKIKNYKLKGNILKRTNIIFTSILIFSCFFLIYHYLTFFFKSPIKKYDKNIVLLQIDGLSADLLFDYNKEAENKYSFYEEHQATIYDNFRTIYPHTAHFFKFFYSGKSKVKNFDQTLQKNRIDFSKSFESNLIKSLQDVDVNFKYLTYHRAAVPEGTDFGIKNYKGLRSYYLTEKLSFIPEFLKLDYHPINSTSNSIVKKLKGSFSKKFKKFLVNKNKQNNLENFLLPELIKLTQKERNFFVVFHNRWDSLGGKGYFLNYYDPDQNLPKEDKCFRFNKLMKKNDMTFDSEFEKNCLPYIVKSKNYAAKKMLEVLDNFLIKTKELRLKNNIEFIITSDHGYMTRDRKMSYGFHFDEYVVKVPFIVLDGKKKFDKRNFFTLDIAGYILDNFGIKSNSLYKYANPLSETLNNQFYTYTIVRRGKFFNKWYLSYYHKDLKFTLNLHPKSEGDFSVYRINGFDQKKINRKITKKDEEIFSEIIELIALKKKDVTTNLHYLFK